MEKIDKLWHPDMKPCLECGKIHTRRKFCSPYCGSKYNAKNKRIEMGVNNPKFSSASINSIIQGDDTSIVDNSYNFVFSNKLEDWLGRKNKKRRKKYQEKRKAKKNGKDTTTT